MKQVSSRQQETNLLFFISTARFLKYIFDHQEERRKILKLTINVCSWQKFLIRFSKSHESQGCLQFSLCIFGYISRMILSRKSVGDVFLGVPQSGHVLFRITHTLSALPPRLWFTTPEIVLSLFLNIQIWVLFQFVLLFYKHNLFLLRQNRYSN